jgi:hypothetical protein
MTGTLRHLALALVAAAGAAQAQAPAGDPAPTPSLPEWRSMSHAKVAVPLPVSGPMASDLAARATPPKWADVPLPPPPALTGAPAGPAKAPAAQELVAGPGGSAAGASLAGAAAVAGAPAAPESAASGEAGSSKEPKVKMAADQTGAMISVTQDLDSDKIRMNWAGAGGTLPAFEGNLGMILMYKDLSKDAGAGAYMNGVGLSAGLRVALLTLEPPVYASRDTSWTAWKLGVGADVGATNVTINLPTYRIAGKTYGGPQTASMSSTTLTMSFGFMKAFGSFDSPNEWSGFAVGAEWAPSSQKTVLTTQDGKSTTSSSFNARGFAVNFESGSLQSMASKMGKKAKIKMSIFFLPPTGDLPFLMNATLGAVWY